MQSTTPQVEARLGFTRAEDVSPDSEREGMLRARTLPFGAMGTNAFDFRTCVLHDCRAGDTETPDLETMGFEIVDLSGNAGVRAALEVVRSEDAISEESANALRESLKDFGVRLQNGKELRFQYVAPDGLIHRRAGPNGLNVNPAGMQGSNGHDAARTIHGDQDVYGTPLKQMMNGAAPEMFRHQTPDGRNTDSSMFLLNLWIPIQQITRPLVLMDRRTLDQRRHQLRYALPVTSFLERDEDRKLNDIWTFLPHSDQRWYFSSWMEPYHAYAFDTLGEPHGSCALPGEDVLRELYERLERACSAVASGDAAELEATTRDEPPVPAENSTAPILAAAERMSGLLREARQPVSSDWVARARAAMDSVIRKSVEMRVVATTVTQS